MTRYFREAELAKRRRKNCEIMANERLLSESCDLVTR